MWGSGDRSRDVVMGKYFISVLHLVSYGLNLCIPGRVGSPMVTPGEVSRSPHPASFLKQTTQMGYEDISVSQRGRDKNSVGGLTEVYACPTARGGHSILLLLAE